MFRTICFGLFLATTMFFISCTPPGIYQYAKKGDIAGIQPYIQKGEIEKEDHGGMTPLMYAAWFRQSEMAQYLCEKGANVNKQDHKGMTALMYASYWNSLPVVEILIKNGASTTLVNSKGKKAIDYAEQYKYVGIIAILKSSSK